MKRPVTIAVAALLLTACGGGDTGTTPPSTSPAPTSSTTATPTPSETPTTSATPTPTSTVEEVAPEPPAPAPVEQPAVQEQAPAPAVLPGGATFDPNSADGYGPNQPLPPLCVRFPNDFDCDGNPLPKAPAPAQQYPMNPNGTVNEGDITANFWKCMQAGGTEETCRQ